MTHILMVEDDELTQRALGLYFARLLENRVQITACATNAEALRHAKASRPDLVTTDFHHAEGTGLELVLTLRALPHLGDVPILVVSGNTTDAQKVALYRAGAFRVLQKPWTSEDLADALAVGLKRPGNPIDALITAQAETASVDYKARLALETSRDRAAIAKDVLAFANSGGGVIIVGVAEGPGGIEEVGVDAVPDPTEVNQALRPFVGQGLAVGVTPHRRNGLLFTVIRIPSAGGRVALARQENADARLFRGRVYVRTEAAESAEVQDAELLDKLFERVMKTRWANR